MLIAVTAPGAAVCPGTRRTAVTAAFGLVGSVGSRGPKDSVEVSRAMERRDEWFVYSEIIEKVGLPLGETR